MPIDVAPPTMNVIGAGSAGGALAKIFHLCGAFRIQGITNRALHSAKAAAEFIGAGQAVNGEWNFKPADITMISASDAALPDIVSVLALEGPSVKDRVVFHISGGETSSVLSRLRDKGAEVASIHPIKTFADQDRAVTTFKGTVCAVEGDKRAVRMLTHAFKKCGAVVEPIKAKNKLLEHAGAVFACNFLPAVVHDGYYGKDRGVFKYRMDSMQESLTGLRSRSRTADVNDDVRDLIKTAQRCFEAAGLSTASARAATFMIAGETLDNITKLGLARALTGPISRGSVDFVSKQLAALDAFDANVADLYRKLGLQTAELASEKGAASPHNLREIRKALSMQ